MFFIMTIRLSVALSDFAVFAIGTVLMVIIYQFGWISGGHFNPAVSIAIIVRGNVDSFPARDYVQWIMYIVSQLLGAMIGGIFGNVIGGNEVCLAGPYVDEDSYNLGQGFLGEFFFTLLLTYVVLHTGTHQGGNQFYGLAIGFSLFIAANCIGSITGCAINPAVWFGLNMAGLICDSDDTNRFDQIWLYWGSQIVAACLSGVLFRFIYAPAHEQLQVVKMSAHRITHQSDLEIESMK